MRPSADYWIQQFQLTEHVEGGSFRELYRSPLQAPVTALPAAFGGDRNFCTGIYFLLKKAQFSAFHRIRSDELWHFYYGDPLVVYELDTSGALTEHHLGSNPEQGQQFQRVIKAGSWFASRVQEGGEYALVGCTVSPGFDFADFDLAEREALLKEYPQHQQLIEELTRV
jgi:predicted cupin superfamily sugar epimerase